VSRAVVRQSKPVADLSGFELGISFEKYEFVEKLVSERLGAMWQGVRQMMLASSKKNSGEYGYDFETVTALCNLVSGLSVVLFDGHLEKMRASLNGRSADERCGHKRIVERNRELYLEEFSDRKKFVDLMVAFFPWTPAENKSQVATEVYRLLRCQHVHSLGLSSGKEPEIFIVKGNYAKDDLAKLEDASFVSNEPLLRWHVPGKSRVLAVSALYAGVHQMLRRLSQDDLQMSDANGRLSQGQYRSIDITVDAMLHELMVRFADFWKKENGRGLQER
jgi:hypothetical protein